MSTVQLGRLQLPREEVRKLRDSLEQLQRHGPARTDFGICWNWRELYGLRLTYDIVSDLSVDWPGCEGYVGVGFDRQPRCDYPIRPEWDEHDVELDYWQGDQLAKRESLIEYLLSKLDEALSS